MKIVGIGLAFALLLLSNPALAAGAGAKYGSRNPASCPDRKQPTSGGPSVQQATRYLSCDMENESSRNLYLVTNVQLQVAPKGRPFNPVTDSAQGIDPSQPVYDIRGAFRMYQCADKSSMLPSQDQTKNCRYEDYQNTKGSCWRDTFADWHCELSYSPNYRNKSDPVAPPQ
jgi:hypothetical protein